MYSSKMDTKKSTNAIPPQGHSDLAVIALKKALALNKDPLVATELEKCYTIVNGLNEYLEKTTTKETELQAKIFSDTFEENWEKLTADGLMKHTMNPVGMSGHVEGQFLRVITQLMGAKKVLEIGMFTGYSAVTFAESPFCEEVITTDIEPYLAEFVKSRIAGTVAENKIKIMVGPAMESLKKLHEEGHKFDLIFIDANRNGYLDYYKFIMDNKLVSATGGIIVDNVLWKAELWPEPTTPNAKAIFESNEYVRNDDRVIQAISPLRDGVMIIKPI